MKLRYNVQQRLKKSNKKAKFLFEDEKNTKEEDLIFTHKGKKINENDNFEIEENDNEDYYNEMNNYIEKINENPKLTKKEKLKEIINHSKKYNDKELEYKVINYLYSKGFNIEDIKRCYNEN